MSLKSLFCPHHGKTDHFIFLTKERACLTCMQHLLVYQAEEAAVIGTQVRNALSKEEFKEILPAINQAKKAIKVEDEDIAILALVVCEAARKKTTVENVISKMQSSGSFL